MNLQSNTVFDPDIGVIGRMLYHLYILLRHHVSYAPANFEVAASNGFEEDVFSRKNII